MKLNNTKQFIVTNLEYRIGVYNPGAQVNIGTGNVDGEILVIQPHVNMPERDAITGALKNFDMLNDAYRATSKIVDLGSKLIEPPVMTNMCKVVKADVLGPQINRYYLKELIEIIDPLIVVACGLEVMSLLSQRNIRSFKRHSGKSFQVKDIIKPVFYATLNPFDYGFERAPIVLKRQGKKEWTRLADMYRKLKEKQERERWIA